MMLKEKSNPWAKLKYLYILPVAAIAVTAFARPEISETAEEISRMSDALGREQVNLLFSRFHDISAVKVNDLTAIVEAKATKTIEEAVQVSTVLKDTAKPVEVKYIPAEVGDKLQGSPVFEMVEQMPEFPGGGMPAALEYIQKNMQYPESAKENGTQGRVTVQFVVDKAGNVTEPKVLRSVDKELDAEAIRLMKSMPKWKPGMQKGKAVAVKFTMPVLFRLEGGEVTSSQLVTLDRRVGTIPATEEPLFIVDGIEAAPSVMAALKPESIQSISVLKDEASTKIYGERGKNGVILITLKQEPYPMIIGTKDVNKAVTSLTVKGAGKSNISIKSDNKKQWKVFMGDNPASKDDLTVYVDGTKMDMEGKELSEVVPANQIETIEVRKDEINKGTIYITTKKSKGKYTMVTGEGKENVSFTVKGGGKASAEGEMRVEGIVQDKDGEPIVGAAVLIEGTSKGTVTNVDGRFVISVSKGDKLVASYVGMKTAKVKVAPKVTITLKDE